MGNLLLASSYAKIERAKEHICDVEAEVSAFLDSKPYVVGTKRDPQTRRLIYYVVSVRETPRRVAVLLGDALQNLRSSLDHLACQLVLAGTSGQGDISHVYFPIYDCAAKYEASKPARIKGMGPEAIEAIDAVRPYKGGNDTLWRLNRLNNIDKHRLLVTVGSAFRSMDLMPVLERGLKELHEQLYRDDSEVPKLPEWPPMFVRPADRLFPLKAGDELFIDAPDADVNKKIQFRFDVALGEPGIIEGESVLGTLQHMLDLVSSLIPKFEPLLAPGNL